MMEFEKKFTVLLFMKYITNHAYDTHEVSCNTLILAKPLQLVLHNNS
jgi:hypothetical protein